jgi:hypothetical protein
MAGGYGAPPDSNLAEVRSAIRDFEGRLRELATPTGTQIAELVKEVRDRLGQIPTEVSNAVTALGLLTPDQVRDLVENPPTGSNVTGDISATGSIEAAADVTAGGTITAGGDITTPGILTALASRSLVLATGYAGAWLDSTGRLGISPSSIRFKTNLEEWQPDISRILLLRAVLFRYDPQQLGDMDPDAPKQVGFIAEELEALGFHEFVFYDGGIEARDAIEAQDATYDENGVELTPAVAAQPAVDAAPSRVQGINYDRLTVALLVLAKWQDQRITRIEQHLGLTAGTE